MKTAYDRMALLEAFKNQIDGRDLSPVLVFETSLTHRFVKLSEAFCQLMEDKNIESAQHLLRPLFDCIMYLFVVNAVDDPDTLCRKAIDANIQLSDIMVTAAFYNNGKEFGLKERNIIRMMDNSGLFKGMETFYGKLSAQLHTSFYHILHLYANGAGIIRIGGDVAASYKPLVEDTLEDFDLIQSMYFKMVHYI